MQEEQNYCVVEGAQFVMEFNSPSQELYDDWIELTVTVELIYGSHI